MGEQTEQRSMVGGYDEDQFEEICQTAFKLFDSDGDGQLTEDEIRKGYHIFNMNPTKEDIRQTMKELDLDESGTIDYQEFTCLMKKVVQELDMEDERKKLTTAFKRFDRDKNGFLDRREFTRVLKWVGNDENFTKTEIDDFFNAVDTDSNGLIDLNEFVLAFSGEDDVFASVRTPEYEKVAESPKQQVSESPKQQVAESPKQQASETPKQKERKS